MEHAKVEVSMSKEMRERCPEEWDVVNRRAFFQMVTGAVTGAVVAGIGRALNVFRHSEIFASMRRLAMARNFSWSSSALSYESVYARTIQSRVAREAA